VAATQSKATPSSRGVITRSIRWRYRVGRFGFGRAESALRSGGGEAWAARSSQ